MQPSLTQRSPLSGKSIILMIEGKHQISWIEKIINSGKKLRIIEICKDYNDVDRIVVLQKIH